MAAALAASVLLACQAWSHAVVLETRPADGALLAAAPEALEILFNEPVRPIRAQVLDASGTEVATAGSVSSNGSTVRIALPDIEAGSYIASYRAVSIDSHPIAGSVVFSVGHVSGSVTARAASTDDSGWGMAFAAVRAVLFAGVLGGAGGILFLVLVPVDGAPAELRIRWTISRLAALGCSAAILALGVQGGLLVNGPAASILDFGTWRVGVASLYGRTAIAAMLGLALVAVGVGSSPGAPLARAAYLGCGLALASFALSGHVVASGPRWLTVPSLIAHTSAAAFWAGSLLPLALVLHSDDPAAPAVLGRFSRIAGVAVAVLLAAGTVIAVLQVRSLSALVTTGYGVLLSAKLCLVAILVGLAALNKLRLTPSLARGSLSARAGLQRTVAAELLLVAAILAATGVLGTRPPPRVLAEGAAHAAHLEALAGAEAGLIITTIQDGRIADITLASAWSGPNRATITLRSSDGSPLEAKEVTFAASNPGDGVEPILRSAERSEAGDWLVADLLLAPPGRWTLRIDVLVSDFEQVTLETRTDLLSRQPQPGS
jgi:copper transport protein